MAECKLDHSLEDVQKKFETQSPYLPSNIKEAFPSFISSVEQQQELNQVFHLLKKYDLVSEDEKFERNNGLARILKKYHNV